MSQNGWLDMKRLAALSSTARDNLAGPLEDLGRQWAKSPDRPRPEQSVLHRWEHVLDDWIADPSLPLVIRGSGRPGERATCSNGREVRLAPRRTAPLPARRARPAPAGPDRPLPLPHGLRRKARRRGPAPFRALEQAVRHAARRWDP